MTTIIHKVSFGTLGLQEWYIFGNEFPPFSLSIKTQKMMIVMASLEISTGQCTFKGLLVSANVIGIFATML